MQYFHLKPVSGNSKTGPIPVSTSTAATCPSDCPFRHDREGGCYAGSGPLAIHWGAVTTGSRGTSWAEFLLAVARLPAGLWRHNQAGDLPHDGEGNVSADMVMGLVKANKPRGKRGFTYTHHDVIRNHGNRRIVREANAGGFTVNLSGNDPTHADALAGTDCGPVVVVVVLPADAVGKADRFTPAGRRIVTCPATYRDDVTCASCGLCAVATRDVIVGFPAHGSGARKASAIARALEGAEGDRKASRVAAGAA